MVGVREDCFAGAGPMLSLDEAVARVSTGLPVLATPETVPLWLADGRVAAEDAFSRTALPPFDNAAVDGYALRFADISEDGETRLPVAGRIAAGASPMGRADSGAAWRIFTGAPMPEGADTVAMQEDVRCDADGVLIPPGLSRGANRRLAGEDVPRGGLVVPAGRRLRPQDLALAAAAGLETLSVRRRLRVALFSTGDELSDPGVALEPGRIHDANRVMLAALLTRLGAVVNDLGILRDDPAGLPERLAQAGAGHDLILTSGGVSVGEEDHVKAAVEAVGRLAFWRLAIKPGKPVAMGTVGTTPFVGLPGNPVAAYVTGLFVVRPLLARLGGATFTPPLAQPVRAAFHHRRKPGRREFMRVSLGRSEDGVIEARKSAREGSGMLTSLTGSDGLAEIAQETGNVVPGDLVGFHPHALLW